MVLNSSSRQYNIKHWWQRTVGLVKTLRLKCSTTKLCAVDSFYITKFARHIHELSTKIEWNVVCRHVQQFESNVRNINCSSMMNKTKMCIGIKRYKRNNILCIQSNLHEVFFRICRCNVKTSGAQCSYGNIFVMAQPMTPNGDPILEKSVDSTEFAAITELLIE